MAPVIRGTCRALLTQRTCFHLCDFRFDFQIEQLEGEITVLRARDEAREASQEKMALERRATMAKIVVNETAASSKQQCAQAIRFMGRQSPGTTIAGDSDVRADPPDLQFHGSLGRVCRAHSSWTVSHHSTYGSHILQGVDLAAYVHLVLGNSLPDEVQVQRFSCKGYLDKVSHAHTCYCFFPRLDSRLATHTIPRL